MAYLIPAGDEHVGHVKQPLCREAERAVRRVVEACRVEDAHTVVPALLAQVPHRTARLQARAGLPHLAHLRWRERAVKHGVPVPQEPLCGRATWPLCGRRANARGQSACAKSRGQEERAHATGEVEKERNPKCRTHAARQPSSVLSIYLYLSHIGPSIGPHTGPYADVSTQSDHTSNLPTPKVLLALRRLSAACSSSRLSWGVKAQRESADVGGGCGSALARASRP